MHFHMTERGQKIKAAVHYSLIYAQGSLNMDHSVYLKKILAKAHNIIHPSNIYVLLIKTVPKSRFAWNKYSFIFVHSTAEKKHI